MTDKQIAGLVSRLLDWADDPVGRNPANAPCRDAAAAITALQARVRELEDIDASRHDNDEQLCGAVEYAGYIKGTWPVQVIRDLADRNDKWAERTYAAEARNAELVEALEAYADECDGKCCTPRERWRKSCGYRARAALVQGDKP